ncbi:MAG: transcription initiation factor E subunit alpha [Candidatus Altiarchaeota archaeon]|nr:transcription initiation factor E subunit alpha [Candidatus Altiarchaeota archaeon]
MESLDKPEIVNALATVAGANSLDVVGELSEESEMDEFSLAERLGMDVKTVRKILYKLYDSRLVKFRRIKDEETGWYIYLWKFHDDKLDALVQKIRVDKITNIRERLDYEQEHQFFMCENSCTRMPFENAMESVFVCKHCSGKMDFLDNAHIIKNLEDQLKQIERAVGN